MQKNQVKKHPALGCCGIDCGLCPRFHTKGTSRCPGCAGEGFFEKHPSCSVLTCCFKTRGLETCGSCADFICTRMRNWDAADSFVTHRNCLSNLRSIKENGLAVVVSQKERRRRLLEHLLRDFDDGRSKSFYCLSAALLPVEQMEAEIAEAGCGARDPGKKKQAAKLLREKFTLIARRTGTELSYRTRA
jgi:hypothetical protein